MGGRSHSLMKVYPAGLPLNTQTAASRTQATNVILTGSHVLQTKPDSGGL